VTVLLVLHGVGGFEEVVIILPFLLGVVSLSLPFLLRVVITVVVVTTVVVASDRVGSYRGEQHRDVVRCEHVVKRRELVVCDRKRKSLADFRRIRPEMCQSVISVVNW
jgi:hypothetical protein